MTKCRFLALALPLLALTLTATAQEETAPAEEPAGESLPYDLEVGFRILQISGNEDMYRTQINERSGFLLRSFTLLTTDPGFGPPDLFDRIRIDARDLGAGPAGSLRVEADRADQYRFRLGYRRNNSFSALPAFANPLLGQGIIPGQHTYDRTRNTLDADLDLFINRSVTPFVGVSLQRFSGPGTTTYALGADEFRLSQDLRETEQEVRAGAGFILGRVYGSATQGWRRARGSQRLTLDEMGSDGNNANPILGRPVRATMLTRQDSTSVDTPFTSIFVGSQLGERVRVSGDFVRFAADSSGDLTENAAGSFVSFALSRFFNGLSETGSSSAKNTTWRGAGRAEVALTEHIAAFAGYRKEHRDLEGTALINTLFLQTLTFGGVDPRDVESILNARSSMERDEDVAHIGMSARALGPFAVRVEYRHANQDLTVAPDLSEIVVPGAQGGDFERRVTTFDGSASYTRSGLTLGAAYRRDQASEPVFRTDFLDRDRIRLRAAWAATKWLRAGVTAEETNQENDQAGIDLDARARQYSGDVEVAAREGVVFRASVSRFQADNSILIRRPENFTIEPTLYAEDGRSMEGGVAVSFAPLSFDVSAARFDNRGSNPFDVHRIRARVGFDLPARTRTGLVAEYAKDEYSEPAAGFAGFDASRFGLFVRYRP
ncbi:MAG TPA: hypothetical protein VMM79_01080 [Longimicrobiales bacterium]|nr:hypothetical protein [Longimicrobiales bacterium]